jgi:hypothetical protein
VAEGRTDAAGVARAWDERRSGKDKRASSLEGDMLADGR